MKEYIIELSADDEKALSILLKAYNLHEIVRCKDCKKKGNSYLCRLDSDLEEHGGNRTDEYDDWFCADGERQ